MICECGLKIGSHSVCSSKIPSPKPRHAKLHEPYTILKVTENIKKYSMFERACVQPKIENPVASIHFLVGQTRGASGIVDTFGPTKCFFIPECLIRSPIS